MECGHLSQNNSTKKQKQKQKSLGVAELKKGQVMEEVTWGRGVWERYETTRNVSLL